MRQDVPDTSNVLTVKQGSTTTRPWTSTGPWVILKWSLKTKTMKGSAADWTVDVVSHTHSTKLQLPCLWKTG